MTARSIAGPTPSPGPVAATHRLRLVDAIDAVLPQTQCMRCGYPDCRRYAEAVAEGDAAINQCPPGGDAGVQRLAHVTGRPVLPLNATHGAEAPRQRAVIDEGWCIGCTLCLDACPVDSIVGGPKRMHTVIDAWCTGCELCIPVCPVDCIALVNVSGERTGWDAWSATQAAEARVRYGFHQFRLARVEQERQDGLSARAAALKAPSPAATPPSISGDAPAVAVQQDVIAAALARARARRAG